MEMTFSCCAYCWKNEESWEHLLYFKCQTCHKHVHYECVRGVQPSPLLADTFFNFICQACGEGGKEEFVRTAVSWHNVVMLALYNLHKTGQGRCGYFHYKTHICAFIDRHWNTFFGALRKKTSVWMGTVAGTLSIGCPQYFLSGTHVGQAGHWRLAEIKPPTPHTQKKKPAQRKKAVEVPVQVHAGPRKCRLSDTALAAAVELREKSSTLQANKKSKKQSCLPTVETFMNTVQADDFESNRSKEKRPGKTKAKKPEQKNVLLKERASSGSMSLNCSLELPEELYLSDSQFSVASSDLSLSTDCSYSSSFKGSAKEEDVAAQFENFGHLENIMLMTNSEDEADLDIELVVTENFLDPRPASPGVDIMFKVKADTEQLDFEMSSKSPVCVNRNPPVEVKQTAKSNTGCFGERNIHDELYSYSDGEQENRTQQESSEEEGGPGVEGIKSEVDDVSQLQDTCGEMRHPDRPHKRRKLDDTPPPAPPQQLKRISLFEEGELFSKLNDVATRQTLPTSLAQFRRKLICNQTNREFGLPVFDLESQMDMRTCGVDCQKQPGQQYKPSRCADTKETRDLDRFLIHDKNKKMESRSYTGFHQRLVGVRDQELTPVVSPYTTRILLPFIWRNTSMSQKPLKLRLLEEIVAFPHRNDASWVKPCSPSIDYCYIRPEHVPSVNALCREFFWPGIDVSECLQYPDFSCVVMYRKIVIAFAFMVPDRGYNEAYISFIFTHPEWRGAGIATFMLYHLIQTCMGKDVLLHVSVTNPAMLLYQKFGFKCQELILNFYYKYFPLNCKESTHAFLMRLSR
ncbi:hypothetical protein BsWGS_02595 [Bradybaena similaris]